MTAAFVLLGSIQMLFRSILSTVFENHPKAGTPEALRELLDGVRRIVSSVYMSTSHVRHVSVCVEMSLILLMMDTPSLC